MLIQNAQVIMKILFKLVRKQPHLKSLTSNVERRSERGAMPYYNEVFLEDFTIENLPLQDRDESLINRDINHIPVTNHVIGSKFTNYEGYAS